MSSAPVTVRPVTKIHVSDYIAFSIPKYDRIIEICNKNIQLWTTRLEKIKKTEQVAQAKNHLNCFETFRRIALVYRAMCIALQKPGGDFNFETCYTKYCELIRESYELLSDLTSFPGGKESVYLNYCQHSLNEIQIFKKLCDYGKSRTV